MVQRVLRLYIGPLRLIFVDLSSQKNCKLVSTEGILLLVRMYVLAVETLLTLSGTPLEPLELAGEWRVRVFGRGYYVAVRRCALLRMNTNFLADQHQFAWQSTSSRRNIYTHSSVHRKVQVNEKTP